MADDGARLLAMQSNFYDTPEVTWASDAAGTPSVTAPGRHGEVTLATLAAPGTKASPDGSSVTVDSITDADGTSASTISSLTASVDLGAEGGVQKVRFVDQHRRGLLTAGGLYDLRVSHTWSHTGTFPITVKLSDGRVLVTSVTVRDGAPAQPTGPVVGPCDKPTVSFPSGSSVRDDSRLDVSFTHLTPNTWVDVLIDDTKIGTVHTDATGSGTQDVPITYQTPQRGAPAAHRRTRRTFRGEGVYSHVQDAALPQRHHERSHRQGFQ